MATDSGLIFQSSQTPDGPPAPRIFFNPSGSPMEIFVDAGVVTSRPKLMRTLRKSGANICKGVALAQIILVDATSRSGRQFIRDWGQSKIVLEYLWARKSVEANKPLVEEDNWGGCITVDDGRPISSDQEDEDDKGRQLKSVCNSESLPPPIVPFIAPSRSPLPTPRHTPPEISASSHLRDPAISQLPSSTPTRVAASIVANGNLPTADKDPASSTPSHYLPQSQPRLVNNIQYIPQSQSSNPIQHFPQTQPPSNNPMRHYPSHSNSMQHFPQTPGSISMHNHPQISNNAMQQFAQTQPPPGSNSIQHFRHTSSNSVHHFPQSQPTSNNSMPNFSQYQHPQSHNSMQTFPQALPANINLMPNFSQFSQHQHPQGNLMPQFSQPLHINPMQNFSQSQPNLGNMANPQGFMNIGGPPEQYDGQKFMQSILDVMRHNGIDPINAQAMLGSMLTGPLQEQLLSNLAQHPTFYSQSLTDGSGHSPEPPFVVPDSADVGTNGVSSASVHSPQIRPSSHISLSSSPVISPPPAIPSPPRRSKGKRRAVSPSRPRHKVSLPIEPIISPKYVTASPRMTASPIKVHPKVGSPRLPGKTFTTKSGEPLSFFVQVDLRPRLPVVTKIKKNGGVLDSSHMNADYAVLYRNSTSFNALLNSRIAAEKPAVNSTYVDDCVQEDALLDPTTYLFHGSTSNKRKRTQSTSSPSTPEKARIKNEKAEKKKQDRIKRKKDKERKEAEGRRVKVEEDESPYYGPPSPSPPPESDRVLWREGHYLYSESERTYASRYIRFLLERDPSISNAAIALALNIKMPHHSSRSWGNYVSQTARNEIETIRKKVGIARRKAKSVAEAPQQPEPQGLADENSLSGRAKLNPLQQQDAQRPNLEQQDLEYICRFFAMGGDDGGDDEHVWALLANQQECKTAPTWPEFYEKHHAEVNAGLARLYAAAETAEAVSAGPSADVLRPKMEMVWK